MLNTIIALRKAIRQLEDLAENLNIERDPYELSVIYNSISCLCASIDIIENMEVTDV